MQRDLNALAQAEFDVLVIGGGIYGAAIAWEAAARGLSVALVEKGDFASATSANSLKIIHGGLRYLQHADIARVRESMFERRSLMRIAPHLVHPLPVLLPTYGHGMKGREVMALAILANDTLGIDRNQGLPPARRIPHGRTIGPQETLRLLPGIKTENLTGGAMFYDARVYNSERLVLEYLLSATQRSAQIANYAQVTGLLRAGDRITGAQVEDRLGGGAFEVRARLTLNATGPWLHRTGALLRPAQPVADIALAKSFNVVIRRQLFETYAVGLSAPYAYRDTDALIDRGSRLLFTVPWRGRTMIGTEYKLYDRHPDDFAITETDVAAFLADFNQSYAPARLTPDDVTYVQGGLVPISGVDPKTGDIRVAKHFHLDDHKTDGVTGVLSVTGVKYTTARDVARRAIDWSFGALGRPAAPSITHREPLVGGRLDDVDAAVGAATAHGLDAQTARELVYNYGAFAAELLDAAAQKASPALSLPDALIEAQVARAVRAEMACTLADVIFRRTDLGSAGHPGPAALTRAAAAMGALLGWDDAKIRAEIHAVEAALTRWRDERIPTDAGLADSAVQ